MDLEGKGTERSVSKASDAFAKCLEYGHPKAGYRLGMIYLDSDPKKSVKYFSRSAELGSGDAMLELGKMSLAGNGMIRSARNAEKWFRKASARGIKEAEDYLRECGK